MLLGIDHGGGRVDRLKQLFAPMPSMAELAAAGMAQLRLGARIIAAELEATGFNLNFAPVVDLRLPGSILAERCLAADPTEVARLASAFVEELAKRGVLTCAKHFRASARQPWIRTFPCRTSIERNGKFSKRMLCRS